MSDSAYSSRGFKNSAGFLRKVSNNKCYICKKEHTLLEVHHIDRNVNNNHLFNLVVLCIGCHKIAHKSDINKIDYRKYLMNSITDLLVRLTKEHIEDLKVIEPEQIKSDEITSKIQPFGHPLSTD